MRHRVWVSRFQVGVDWWSRSVSLVVRAELGLQSGIGGTWLITRLPTTMATCLPDQYSSHALLALWAASGTLACILHQLSGHALVQRQWGGTSNDACVLRRAR